GTTNFVFTVTLANPPVNGTVTVDWATANGTATAGSDYVAANGTLSFVQGGPLTQTVTVVVNGDTTAEPNETFFVNLSNASSNAAIGTPGQGIGTITNDDGPRLTVSALQVAAGASVTTTLTNGLGGATDWLGLYACNAADVAYQQFTYVGAGLAGRTWTVPAS